MQPPPLLALLLAAILCRGGCGETRGLGPVPAQDTGYDVVYPVKVDEQGSFLSYNLSHRWLYKRAISVQSRPLAFYTLDHRGQQLRFNLSLNHHLLAPGFVSERRFGGLAHAKIQASSQNSCHMIGSVQNQDQESGLAALSTCDGLKGVFRLADEDFFIEPLAAQHKSRETPVQPHRIYKRHLPVYNAEEFITVESTKQGRKQPILIRTCGVHESLEKYEKRRERWEEKQKRKRRIRQRSVSKEKWVETLVVADPKMVEYHGSENIERYVLTVMNMVAGLFHDASIGNPIHISVVRLIFLEEEEEDLKITHHADNTLRSFCKWQKAVNVKGDAHPLHHDVAVLLTRKDICAAMNRPCETLGLSHVSGMCQPHRSCNINEDTGLPLAFTVAHELGHSFGIQHDGSGNDCEPVGKRPFVMSPQLLYDTSPLTWSRCSREYITRFLDRGWGLCLDDPPAKEVIDYPSIPPGVLYDVSHQCRLQYGASSTYCDDMDSVCNTLWCSVGNTCHSKLDAAVDGTKCDENKWCFNGECVRVGYRAESINGGWAAWSSWAACSRTCGAGVQSAERQCNSPTPKYGGRYCLGERKRYRVCNMKPCPADRPSFRHIQCSRFDARPYKGKLYKWTPIPNNINPCELHCRPDNEYFAEKLRDAVIDGTLCYQGNSSRDMCINGICKNVGCDYEIDSYAVEDRCGVCRGDGSTCQTVMKTFEEREGLGYVDVGLIPAGAREIHIEEVAEAENFLALRSEDPEKYFLNGGWTIQWNGDYPVAGTTFTYKRTGNWENLTSPGPTEEPVWIQLLFQEKNPGIRYQYTIQRESDQDNEITATEFFWQYGSWTKCTVTCGTGVQRQIVHCVEKLAGIVDEPYCDALSRPDDQQRSCSEEPCPSRWWSGEWQPCSTTCGDAGLMKRTVLCIQSVGLDEQQALPPSKCQHLSKPDPAAPCNREVPCPAQWVPGIWSECSVTCGNGTRQRLVECPRGARAGCDVTQRPASEATCSLLPCSPPDWSGSGSSSQELFNEINFAPDPHAPKLSPSAPNLEDPNAIVEEDFSLGINKKGNVFVDDFYYDYNFINFHEDLSYDPVREKDRTREDLKPDGGAETAKDAQGGSAEVPPSSFPATGPADRTDKGSSASPAVGQKEDPGKAQGSGAPVNLQDAVGVTVPLSVTSSPALSNEGVQPPLRESWPPTPATMTRHPPASHSHRVSVAGTPVNPFTSPVSEESTEGTVSFTRFLPLTSQAPATSPFGQGSESGTPGSTQGSARGMQDPRNLRLPDPSGTKRGDSFDTSQDDHGRPSATRWPVVTDAPTSLQTEEAQVSRGTTAAARTRAWPSLPPPQLSHFADAATKLPPVQEGIESDRTFDDLLSSENPEDDRSYSEGTQDSQPPPISAREDVWAVVSTFNATHEALHPESKILAPHETDSPELQLSAEPTHWEQSKAFPSAWPSGLLPTEQQEPDTRLSQMLFGNRNVRPEKGPPVGAPWISATSSGGLGPSHMSAEHQDPKRNEAPSTIPPATVAAIFSASWETGNWSECSTTCGLGAVWRTVRCSSSTEGDCNPAQKPIPARRCYLRPCSMWRVGNWSKCLGACGAGVKVRDIHCVDSRDQRPLRPFHCQAVWDKPPAQMPCQSQPCLDWYTSSWRECSELCGGGEQERLVTCPEVGRCDHALRPSSTRPCNVHPCAKWTVGFWGQCTATCGGGIQRRQVKCMNTKTGEAEEDRSLCDHEQWPEDTQKCNTQDCSPGEAGFVCERDRLSLNFCQTLLLLGRCHLPTVSAQCCRTCHPDGPGGTQDRGNERASRR